ncbi:LacI family DNA-binding transcriptional regulator [Paraflavisolibacter sp. H34]|uniref:LacI family DNA-binding transcriptional regulator n=1 Tax=Huijunlia imazamoxiresistens TaxID=3127457 RepID=UPI00301A21A1
MENKKELTIYDLAEQLNVSVATVSRALSDHPAVSRKTKRKVSELAEKVGYRKNNFASNLRSQKTYTIAVIVHELNSHFITSVLSGIEKKAAEAQYDIIIVHSSESADHEKANTKNLFHKRVDGLIVSLAYDTTDLSHYEPFLERGIPIVYFDRVKAEATGIKVVIDNFKAGYEAGVHLIGQGCKKIMQVTGNLAQNVYIDRLNGFKKALAEYDLPFTPEQLLITDLSESAGIEAARQVLEMEERPDGLFVVNDLCAAVCMQSLKDAGLRVPGDIALVGFNNDVVSRVVEPKLTTINYAGREMGELAANCLIDQLEGTSSLKPNYTIVLPSELMVRASSLRT